MPGKAATGRETSRTARRSSTAKPRWQSWGLKVRNHCTYQALTVNVAMDLAPFADIDPCGYPGLAVVDLAGPGVMRSVAQAGDELAAPMQSLARAWGWVLAPMRSPCMGSPSPQHDERVGGDDTGAPWPHHQRIDIELDQALA